MKRLVIHIRYTKRGKEQNREEGEMAPKKKLRGGRNRGKSREEEEKEKETFREEGEIGSESREKGDLPPCPTPLYKHRHRHAFLCLNLVNY